MESFTVNNEVGVIVLIPTFPAEVILTFSEAAEPALSVIKAKWVLFYDLIVFFLLELYYPKRLSYDLLPSISI